MLICYIDIYIYMIDCSLSKTRKRHKKNASIVLDIEGKIQVKNGDANSTL